MMKVERRLYEDIETFYRADERRRQSGEADYGVWWRDYGSPWYYRVSYVRATGEVYAAMLALGDAGRVEVLGHVKPDEDDDKHADYWYRTLDLILAGWPEEMAKEVSLQWVRSKLWKARWMSNFVKD